IGGARLDSPKLPVEVDPGQKLRHILEARAELPCAGEELAVLLLEELRIFLQNRATPSSVGNDGIIVFGEEGQDVPSRELAREVAHPGMDVQGSAASLPRRNDHLAAIASQYANRSIIQTGEGQIGYAARKEGHPVTARTNRRNNRAKPLGEEWLLHPRRKPGHVGEPARNRVEEVRTQDQLFEAGLLIDPEYPA